MKKVPALRAAYSNNNRTTTLPSFRDPSLLADYLKILNSTIQYGRSPQGQITTAFTPVAPEVDEVEVDDVEVDEVEVDRLVVQPQKDYRVASASDSSTDTTVKLGTACRSLCVIIEIISAWRSFYNLDHYAMRILGASTTTKITNQLLSLRQRVRRLDVTAFSSNVIHARLDLMKYVTPKRPSCKYLHQIQDCMRGWICRVRLRKHRQGVRAYPIHRIRRPGSSISMSGFTWVNPKNMKRFGHLLSIGSNKRRMSNMPKRARARPTNADWVHCYLTGKYLRGKHTTGSSLFESDFPKSHSKASSKYKKYLKAQDWYSVTKTAWEFEFNTYNTERFYHDYHMGNMYDSNFNCMALKTRTTRRRSEIYRQQYVSNIDYFDKIMEKRRARQR